jgi:hypothetical protein
MDIARKISDLVASIPVNELAIKVKFTEISTKAHNASALLGIGLVGPIGRAALVMTCCGATVLRGRCLPVRWTGNPLSSLADGSPAGAETHRGQG